MALTMHSDFGGTDLYRCGSAALTRAAAFNRPNPNRLLTWNPASFVFQPGFAMSGAESDVHATRCCTSRHVNSLLSRNRHTNNCRPCILYFKQLNHVLRLFHNVRNSTTGEIPSCNNEFQHESLRTMQNCSV